MTRTLLVTADDFGLTEGVCRAIVRAHRDGVVTSASLLAVGSAYPVAAELALRNPTLAVGVHLAAVGEDPPLLPAAEIPTLVDGSGRFPLSYRGFLRRAALGRVNADDVRREFRAQIERVLDDGIPVTHIDTHQHLHLWPAVGRVVVDLARDFGIPCVRLPRTNRRSPLGMPLRVLGNRLARRLDRAGLLTTEGFAGLDEAGDMDSRLPTALERLSRSRVATAELNVHPGEPRDDELRRFAWDYHWDGELSVLVDPSTRARIEREGFALRSWAELGGRGA